MDQVTASIETTYYGHDGRVLTTRYLSECGCEWVVDMWGNVRRVMICERDTDGIRELDQLKLELKEVVQGCDVVDLSSTIAAIPEDQSLYD